MSKKLKMAAVGTGGIWTWCHAAAWKEHPEVEIVAVCDIVKDKADRWARDTGAKAFYDYEEMLRSNELDFIDICTPNLYHSTIAIAALNRGINVFTREAGCDQSQRGPEDGERRTQERQSANGDAQQPLAAGSTVAQVVH